MTGAFNLLSAHNKFDRSRSSFIFLLAGKGKEIPDLIFFVFILRIDKIFNDLIFHSVFPPIMVPRNQDDSFRKSP